MWLEIFKTGTHTSANGEVQEFTEERLDEIANLYNAQCEKSQDALAPVVKGHPRTNEPALGWVERLARRGKVLVAKLKDLSEDLVDDIKHGRFRNVSISLYPNNLLRHLGFLGAAQPAVKDLKVLEYEEWKSEEAANDYNSFEFGSSNCEQKSKLEELQKQNNDYAEKIEQLERQIKDGEFERLYSDFAESNIANGEIKNVLHRAYETGNFGEVAEYYTAISKIARNNSLFTEFSESFSPREKSAFNFTSGNINPARMEMYETVNAILESHPDLTYEEACLEALHK